MAHVSDNSAWLEPGNCISYRLRRAARMTAKKFDDALRPLGIRNTQFTLLAAVNEMGPISIGALSEALATDSTTLNRNLEILSRRAFVEDAPMEDGAVKDGRVRAIDLACDANRITGRYAGRQVGGNDFGTRRNRKSQQAQTVKNLPHHLYIQIFESTHTRR